MLEWCFLMMTDVGLVGSTGLDWTSLDDCLHTLFVSAGVWLNG